MKRMNFHIILNSSEKSSEWDIMFNAIYRTLLMKIAAKPNLTCKIWNTYYYARIITSLSKRRAPFSSSGHLIILDAHHKVISYVTKVLREITSNADYCGSLVDTITKSNLTSSLCIINRKNTNYMRKMLCFNKARVRFSSYSNLTILYTRSTGGLLSSIFCSATFFRHPH
jgi:hypothetical protein